MASTGEVCQQLREALRCLHAEATPGDLRRAAGGWLEGFQGSREAWSVCVACLLSTGEQVPVRVFAAQTMRFKVTRELGQLEVQHWAQLREMLLKCVQAHSGGPKKVLTQLFLALVALVHAWEEWDDVLQGMEANMNKLSFLSFLQLLAEESCGSGAGFKLTGRLEQLNLARQRVRSWSGPVLIYLGNLWASLSGSEEVTQAIDCFTAWIQLGALHVATIQTYEGIASSCFNHTSSENLQVCGAAERSVSAMAEFAPTGLMDILIDHIISLSVRAVSEAKAGHPGSRVFNASFQLFGECLMANVEDLTCIDHRRGLLREEFLKCLSLLYINPSAAVPILEVCGAFADHVGRMGQFDNKSGHINRREQRELLRTIFKETAPHLGPICRLKQGNAMLSATMQETQLRLCEALGVETYMEWVMDSSLESTGSPWENIESGLYCAEAAAPILNQQPIGGPRVLQLLSSLPHVQFPQDQSATSALYQAISAAVIALIDIVLGKVLDAQAQQDLFNGLAGLLIQGIDMQGTRQDCAVALQVLSDVAFQNGVKVPVDYLSSLMHKAKEYSNEGRCMDAILACIVTCVHNMEDSKQVMIREETAHLVLSPMIEALESVASQLAGDRPIQAVEMSVAHVLHQIQIILKSIVEWSGESLEDAQQPNMANPFMQMFTAAIWPLLVHLCLNGLGQECMALTAHCATLALPKDVSHSSSLITCGLLKICHKRFVDVGGECFFEPLCLAINFIGGEPMQIEEFMSLVESVWSSDKFQMLNDPQKAYEVPEFAVAVLNLLGCIIRVHQMLPSDRAIRAVVLGLECAVNCCKCRNKDIAIAAVSCLRVILFCMVDSRQEYIPFIQWTEINGGLVLQGLIGGILTQGSFSQVHKFVCASVLLAVVLGQSGTKGACPLHKWMKNAFAIEGEGLHSGIVSDALNSWTPIIVEIWEEGLNFSGRSGGDFIASKTGRQLKKLIREFAEKSHKCGIGS